MGEWKKYKLKDVCTILGDGLHGTPIYDDKGEFFFINGNNLKDGRISIKNDTKRVPYSEANKYKKPLNNRTILVSINGTIGNVAKYRDEKCILGKSACFFNVKENVDLNFIYYVVANQQFKNTITQLATGTTIKNVSLETMRNYTFCIPPLSIQKQIGKILSSLDDKIELNRRINDNLEQQAQALFKSWFVDFEPFKEGKFVDSELGMIPEGWRIGTLNELIISTLGGDWGKEDAIGNYVKKVSCIRGADIPEIRQGNRGDMPTRFILNKNFLNKALKAEDLVVEISGGSPTQSTGRICQISDTLLKKYDDVVICTNFCRAIKTKHPYSQFIYYLWGYLYKRGVMFLYENGTTGIKNLDINGLLEKEIIVIPDENTVHKYTGLCNLFSQIVQSNGYESERLVKLRDTLLPKLMSGELKINDINN